MTIELRLAQTSIACGRCRQADCNPNKKSSIPTCCGRWAAGLIPIPLADLAAVLPIQVDTLHQLAWSKVSPYNKTAANRLSARPIGSSTARFGASLTKSIPIIGGVLGGVSMSVARRPSTTAVCRVALRGCRTWRQTSTSPPLGGIPIGIIKMTNTTPKRPTAPARTNRNTVKEIAKPCRTYIARYFC